MQGNGFCKPRKARNEIRVSGAAKSIVNPEISEHALISINFSYSLRYSVCLETVSFFKVIYILIFNFLLFVL